MTISNFTKPELDYFRDNCNFVNFESNVFEMRASGYTLEYIAEQLHISVDYVRKLSQRVNRKIISKLYNLIHFMCILRTHSLHCGCVLFYLQ